MKTRTSPISIADYPSQYLMGVFYGIVANEPHALSCVLETNRGCPYNCSYCDWGELHSKVRLFPIEKVFDELDWMAAQKMEFVYCVDANFGMFEHDKQIAEKRFVKGTVRIYKPFANVLCKGESGLCFCDQQPAIGSRDR